MVTFIRTAQNQHLLFAFMLATIFSVIPNILLAQNYYTWEGFEPDKLASMWLLQRIVDPEAKIQIVKKNTRIKNFTPFDTPTAKLRRYHSESTYETIIRTFKVEDSSARCIAKIIHQIEINIWNADSSYDTQRIKEEIWEIIDTAGDSDAIIKKSHTYFDKLYGQCR